MQTRNWSPAKMEEVGRRLFCVRRASVRSAGAARAAPLSQPPSPTSTTSRPPAVPQVLRRWPTALLAQLFDHSWMGLSARGGFARETASLRGAPCRSPGTIRRAVMRRLARSCRAAAAAVHYPEVGLCPHLRDPEGLSRTHDCQGRHPLLPHARVRVCARVCPRSLSPTRAYARARPRVCAPTHMHHPRVITSGAGGEASLLRRELLGR